MKFKAVEEITIHIIETDDAERFHYTRYGPDCWFITMGNSEEIVVDCNELERLFQEHQAKQ